MYATDTIANAYSYYLHAHSIDITTYAYLNILYVLSSLCFQYLIFSSVLTSLYNLEMLLILKKIETILH